MDAFKSILRKCEIFSGLDEADLALVASAAQRREVAAGTVLFEQGTERTACFVIAEGRVEIRRDSGDGAERLIILGSGDAVGEQAFLLSLIHI